MIFNLFHKLNFWGSLNKKDRIIRILVLGFIIYTIIYVSLISSFTKQKFDVSSYIHYLYYIISIDFASTLYKLYSFQEKRNKIRHKNKKMINMENSENKNNIQNNHQHNIQHSINSNSDDDMTIPLYISKNKN